MSKTLYHSELAKLGVVTVTVASDVLPSKFKDKPPFVVLTINGEERNYSTENDACAEFFRGQKGRTFAIVAEGREQEALLTYVGEAMAAPTPPAPTGPPIRPPTPPGPPVNPVYSAPPPRPNGLSVPAAPPPGARPAPLEKLEKLDPVMDAKRFGCKLANICTLGQVLALRCREDLKEQFGYEIDAVSLGGIAGTITRKLMDAGRQNDMPSTPIDVRDLLARYRK